MPPADVIARRRRKKRWRAFGMTVFTLVTVFALLTIGRIVYVLGKEPTRSAELSLTPAKPVAASAPVPAPSRHQPPAPPRVRDPASGLSYALLGSPWHAGCPRALNAGMFSWRVGESAVAGTVAASMSSSGTPVTWYGTACSGLLPQQVPYTPDTGLEQAAKALADAIYPQYYDALPHHQTVLLSTETLVGGHDAWEISFSEQYLTPGLAWSSELGAVIVADRGIGLAPAMFYVSVPSNLGTETETTLISSLRLP